jgi:hypothetical protein
MFERHRDKNGEMRRLFTCAEIASTSVRWAAAEAVSEDIIGLFTCAEIASTSVRWAAAEAVSEDIIAAIHLRRDRFQATS